MSLTEVDAQYIIMAIEKISKAIKELTKAIENLNETQNRQNEILDLILAHLEGN